MSLLEAEKNWRGVSYLIRIITSLAERNVTFSGSVYTLLGYNTRNFLKAVELMAYLAQF